MNNNNVNTTPSCNTSDRSSTIDGALAATTIKTATKAKKQKGKTNWDEDMKNDEAVHNGWIDLLPDGSAFKCTLCDSKIKARHRFCSDTYMGKGGHKESSKQQTKLGGSGI